MFILLYRFRKKMLSLFALFTVFSLNAGFEERNLPEILVVDTSRIIVQNYYYARKGKLEELYQARLQASDIRGKLGLRQGRILRRIIDPEATVELPDIAWECEYPSKEARLEDLKLLAESPEFAEIQRHVETLIQKFQRLIFEVLNQ